MWIGAELWKWKSTVIVVTKATFGRSNLMDEELEIKYDMTCTIKWRTTQAAKNVWPKLDLLINHYDVFIMRAYIEKEGTIFT